MTNDAWATFAKEKYEWNPYGKGKMARITSIRDWYWPWIHEHCQNETSVFGRFNYQLQASLDKEANERSGRDLFVR